MASAGAMGDQQAQLTAHIIAGQVHQHQAHAWFGVHAVQLAKHSGQLGCRAGKQVGLQQQHREDARSELRHQAEDEAPDSGFRLNSGRATDSGRRLQYERGEWVNSALRGQRVRVL